MLRVSLSQVRHDRRVGASSAVRFLTDGVLMRQLQSDFLLRTYSIILLDEAHERSLNTDLLLGEWDWASKQLTGMSLMMFSCVQAAVCGQVVPVSGTVSD